MKENQENLNTLFKIPIFTTEVLERTNSVNAFTNLKFCLTFGFLDYLIEAWKLYSISH